MFWERSQRTAAPRRHRAAVLPPLVAEGVRERQGGSGDGCVIHVTSVGAYLPVGPDAPYVTAKAALSTCSNASANEFSPQGVGVNRISLGQSHRRCGSPSR